MYLLVEHWVNGFERFEESRNQPSLLETGNWKQLNRKYRNMTQTARMEKQIVERVTIRGRNGTYDEVSTRGL